MLKDSRSEFEDLGSTGEDSLCDEAPIVERQHEDMSDTNQGVCSALLLFVIV